MRRFATKGPPPGPIKIAARPHLNLVPPPRPPKKIVEERPRRGLRGLLSKLFRSGSSSNRQSSSPMNASTTPKANSSFGPLPNIGLNQSKAPKFLNTDHVTSVLYWYCVDLSFVHSDFERLLPPPNLRNEAKNTPKITFELVRARNPVNLTKWMGYFLLFPHQEQALVYYNETLGAELCGMPLKLRFAPPTIRGLHSPLFDKMPGLPRRNHALILGLPHGYSATQILRVLWDYDLVDDDKLAVERLPVDKVRYGGSPFLLRFQTADEAERFVRDHHNEEFPYSQSRVFCEVVD